MAIKPFCPLKSTVGTTAPERSLCSFCANTTICGTGTEDYFGGAYNFDVDGRYVEFSSPYQGLSKVNKTDSTYMAQRYFDMYRFHITDPIYFREDLKVTIQALGWRSEGRYLPLQDDISSVAYWYSDNLDDTYPKFPSKNDLEII